MKILIKKKKKKKTVSDFDFFVCFISKATF